MKFNKLFFKRWSTLANMLMMVGAAVIASVPTLDITGQQAGVVIMVANVVVAICQAVKQEASDV